MYDSHGTQTWSCELSSYGEVRNITGTRGDCPFRYQGQYEDVETGLYYNRFRYYDPKDGVYVSQDPIGLAGGMNVHLYVKDTNSYIDIFGLSGEIVYQLLDAKGNVNYYGITSRDALTRMAEHSNSGKVFSNMEVLADNLSHDEARSIEGALIRKRMSERLSSIDRANLSIDDQLKKSGLLNKNRGRVKDRWLTDNPLEDLKDKMHDKPKKVSCG